jgi:hypothetical protein
MGDYVYALRSPKLIRSVIVQIGNHTERLDNVGSMSYLFKPYSDWTGYGREKNERYWRVVDRLALLWTGDRPLYTAMTDEKKGHKLRIGQVVYGFKNRGGLQMNVPFSYNDGSELFFEVGQITEILKP